MRTIRIISYLLCTILLLPHSAPAVKNPQQQNNKPIATLNFEYHESLIYIRMTVNDRPNLLFLVNTGANTSVIHSRIADQLRLPVVHEDSVKGSLGTEFAKATRVKKLKAGNAEIKDLCLTRRDLSRWKAPQTRKSIDGILGTDFLSRFNLLIDYKNKKLELRNRTDKPSKPYEVNCPFYLEDGIPVVETALNDSCKARLRYNSGVSQKKVTDVYINVSTETWRDLKRYDERLSYDDYFTATAVGGDVLLPVARIRKMNVATCIISNPYVVVQPEEGYFKQKDARGFFGNNFLEKYETVFVNFSTGTISFNQPATGTADAAKKPAKKVAQK